MDNFKLPVPYTESVSPTGIPIVTLKITMMDELKIALLFLSEIGQLDNIQQAIEFDYSGWTDSVVSRLGIILITQVPFLSNNDFEYLCCSGVMNEIEAKTNDIEFCGVDRLHFGINIGKDINANTLNRLHQYNILTIHEVDSIPLLTSKMKDEFGVDSRLGSNIDPEINPLLVNSLSTYLYMYFMKSFGLNNDLILDRNFINKDNFGNTRILSSLLPNRVGEVRFYDQSYLRLNISKMRTHIEYVEKTLRSITNKECKLVDLWTRYGIFNQSFVQRYKPYLIGTLVYNGRVFVYVDSEAQLKELKKVDEYDSVKILFTKNLDRIYKTELLRSGCGGYDTITTGSLKSKHTSSG